LNGGLWGGLSETDKAGHAGEQEKKEGDFSGADDVFHIGWRLWGGLVNGWLGLFKGCPSLAVRRGGMLENTPAIRAVVAQGIRIVFKPAHMVVAAGS
jgi:hypothetical protein